MCWASNEVNNIQKLFDFTTASYASQYLYLNIIDCQSKAIILLTKLWSTTIPPIQMNVTERNSTLSLDGYIDNGEWDIIATSVNRIEESNCKRIFDHCAAYARVVFNIYLRRRALFYVHNVIIPCVMLSVLTLVQFWLPSESGEKVGVCLQ